MMTPVDPESRWHCCRLWHRKLNNKWNSAIWARKQGCKVPEIYWMGVHPRDIPFDSLPGDFVLKPAYYGGGRSGVLIMHAMTDQMRGRDYTRESLVAAIENESSSGTRMKRGIPIIAQELVQTAPDTGGISHEHKVHMFGDRVRLIENIYRDDHESREVSWYLPDWTPTEQSIGTRERDSRDHRPSAFLEDMLAQARKMGSALGTYVRIDFLLSENDFYFGEMTFTPMTDFSEYGNALFESWWQEMEGHAA